MAETGTRYILGSWSARHPPPLHLPVPVPVPVLVPVNGLLTVATVHCGVINFIEWLRRGENSSGR
jgi:hypothetical protein